MSLYAIGALILNFGCDISKAKRELGYQPQIDLQEGMKRTVNSLKDLLSKYQ
jgi:nucleoside-diphosphate-sugar epimerase